MATPLLTAPLKIGSRTTVKSPNRKMFPGVYRDPRIIVAESAQRVPEESGLLYDLFGVNRADLDAMAMAKRGTDQGVLEVATGGGRSEAAANVMTPANTQRMIDILAEGRARAEFTGSAGWYESEPLLLEFMYELGPDEGKAAFERFTQMGAALSPGTGVPQEIKRSSLAYVMDRQGNLQDFIDGDLPAGFGHAYHSTAHASGLGRLLDTGDFRSPNLNDGPKTRDYYAARMGNTRAFAGDAHDARLRGLVDTRGAENVGSMSSGEKKALRGWHSGIANDVGLDETPAQALGWNIAGTSTGVESPLGAPFLELIADAAGRAGQKYGVPAKDALRAFIRGDKPLLTAGGTAITLGAGASGFMPNKSYASSVGPDGYYNPDSYSVPTAALYEEPKSSTAKFWDEFQATMAGTRGLADTLLMGAAVVRGPLQIPAIAIEGGLLATDFVNYMTDEDSYPDKPSDRGRMNQARRY